MQNIIEKYPVLIYLPDPLRNNPESNSISDYLKKKKRTNYSLMISMIVCFVLYSVLLYIFETIHLKVKELAAYDNIFNLLPLVLFLVPGIIFYRRIKKYDIPESEIKTITKKLKSEK